MFIVVYCSFPAKLYPAVEPLSSRKPLPTRTATHVSRSHDLASRQSDGTSQDCVDTMPEFSDKSGDHQSSLPSDSSGSGHNAILARKDRRSVEPSYTDSVLNMSVQSSRLTAEMGVGGVLSSETDPCQVSARKGQLASRLTVDRSQLPPPYPGTGVPVDSSVHKHGMRTFRSTPLLHSEKR